MSVSDTLHPDGRAYDPFLHAEVGEDKAGAAVTVLSALARLGFEPWTEARELAALGREAAQARLKTHLAGISDIPSLGLASGSVATKLVSLLPERSSRRVADLPEAVMQNGPKIPVFWVLAALVGGLILVTIYF